MFNNRMLAVAAVLVMAVPALGAATPIVVPPVPEQLVEGHTVFTVIEIVAKTATNETRFAAAVAVLVREYQAEVRNQRFPGVLWFNDQYLVNPVQNSRDNAAFRYPCGGAVMAVNRGDPDPRVVMAYANVDGDVFTVGTSEYTYESTDDWVKPNPGYYYYGQDGNPTNNPDPRNDYAWVGAEVDTTTPSAEVWSDTVVGSELGGAAQATQLIFGSNFTGTTPYDYRESYLITDPNDHSWIIDKYEFYTRDGTAGSQNVNNLITKLSNPPMIDTDGDGIPDYQPSEHWPTDPGNGRVGQFDYTTNSPPGLLETQYTYPVWVVNILGSPVFVPDEGNAIRIGNEFYGENCLPFKDLLDDLTAPVNGAACGAALQDAEGLDAGNDTDITLNLFNGVPPWTDDPCMGYQEPSRNGYCYGGQSAAEGCYHGPPGNCYYNTHYEGEGPEVDRCMGGPEYVNTPLRQYNALLYFKLDDLYVAGANRDHSDPVGSTDTNGCSEEQYPWGPNPPLAAWDWQCPSGDDDQEGNSHPFHPTAPPHEEREPCLPAFAGSNPTNHGGSTYVGPGSRANDDGWFQIAAPCDYLHATRNIDIYFAGAGRPWAPLLRNFDVIDLEGSSAPFHDFHSAYPGTP